MTALKTARYERAVESHDPELPGVMWCCPKCGAVRGAREFYCDHKVEGAFSRDTAPRLAR